MKWWNNLAPRNSTSGPKDISRPGHCPQKALMEACCSTAFSARGRRGHVLSSEWRGKRAEEPFCFAVFGIGSPRAPLRADCGTPSGRRPPRHLHRTSSLQKPNPPDTKCARHPAPLDPQTTRASPLNMLLVRIRGFQPEWEPWCDCAH